MQDGALGHFAPDRAVAVAENRAHQFHPCILRLGGSRDQVE